MKQWDRRLLDKRIFWTLPTFLSEIETITSYHMTTEDLSNKKKQIYYYFLLKNYLWLNLHTV